MSFKEEISKIVPILKEGGIIIYPTDTVWGIGCLATDQKAVDRLFSIKKRAPQKKMVLLWNNAETLSHFVERVPPKANNLIEFHKRPLTIVYENAINLPNNVISADGSVAIRIIKEDFCKTLIEQLGAPLVSSSANFSNEPPPRTFDEINAELLALVDYVVHHRRDDDQWEEPSTIVKITDDKELIFIRN